ncbi:MAG: SH3 domain-containing protein [Cellvibrionaceae bacterium]
MKLTVHQTKRWLVLFFQTIAFCYLAMPTQASEKLEVTIIDQYVDLHTGPGRGFPIVHAVEYGQKIVLAKKRTDWIKVELPKGITGWAHRDDLELTLGNDGKLIEFDQVDIDDFINRRWSAGAAAGDFGGADALSIYGGYRFTKNFTLEAKVTHAVGSFSNSLSVGTSLLHETWPHWRVSPYFTMGVAIIKVSPDATLVKTEDRTDSMLMVGLGAQGYITRSFMVRMEYTNNLILTSRNENEEVKEWKIGLNVFF